MAGGAEDTLSSEQDISPPGTAAECDSAAVEAPYGRRRRMRREEVVAAQLHKWYPVFERVSIKSRFVGPLPAPFLAYLQEDGLVLPDTAQHLTAIGPTPDDEEEGQQAAAAQGGGVSFPEVEGPIASALTALGGEVCPKLNWTTPQDAAWVNGGSLKCGSVGDVLLLLKASALLQHDLAQQALRACEASDPSTSTSPSQDYTDTDTDTGVVLGLRRWCRFSPSMHFRAYVTQHTIRGVCPRDVGRAYPFLLQPLTVTSIARAIHAFFTLHVQHRHAVPHYAMDVYVDVNERVWLVDLNAYGPEAATSPLLFLKGWAHPPLLLTQEEQDEPTPPTPITEGQQGESSEDDEEEEGLVVEECGDTEGEGEEGEEGLKRYMVHPPSPHPPYEFRVLANQQCVHSDPLRSFRVPMDMVQGLMPTDLQDLQQLCAQQAAQDDSDSDGESDP